VLAATELKKCATVYSAQWRLRPSIACALACARRWNRQLNTISAIQNREACKSGSPVCRMRRKLATSFFSDDKVPGIRGTAYGLDDKLGLLTETLAITGARPSQAVRLRVEGSAQSPAAAEAYMPKSAKGVAETAARKDRALFGANNPATSLQAEAAAKECGDAPLLLQSDGRSWDRNPGQN